MRLGHRGGWLAIAVVVLAGAAIPARAQTSAPAGPQSAMDDRWHFNLAPYMWTTGIAGDVSVGNLASVPVDASISDVLGNWDIGLQGRFEARKNRFGLGFDYSWNNLGVEAAQTRVGTFTVDVRQIISEGVAFYRVASGGRTDNPAHLDILAGARYMGTRTRLSAETSAGAAYDGEFKDVSWVDGLAGVKFRAPLGSRAALLGRGDIAGFGSDLTWNVEGDLALLASPHWTIGAGWRYMDIDYDNGATDLELKKVDLAYNGPRLWFAYSW